MILSLSLDIETIGNMKVNLTTNQTRLKRSKKAVNLRVKNERGKHFFLDASFSLLSFSCRTKV